MVTYLDFVGVTHGFFPSTPTASAPHHLVMGAGGKRRGRDAQGPLWQESAEVLGHIKPSEPPTESVFPNFRMLRDMAIASRGPFVCLTSEYVSESSTNPPVEGLRHAQDDGV
ncbi:hypothetical protein PENNAL_c0027G03617 [Penicillium nalgiovense]|uniref:Uncharacterized protein n=1 Tax=Penicillium nalgiovense TaxID=60175 RepID=A0A1V6YA09_PENNA|nr:hypothetical protein PENNAL_c0027G03617 [Penicillium nalgiovense]